MDVNAGEETIDIRNDPRQQIPAPAVKSVRQPMEQDGMEAGITQDNLQHALGCRVFPEDCFHLLPNRASDYEFDEEKMLALQGNTSVYLQYQFTRAAKIVRDHGGIVECTARSGRGTTFRVLLPILRGQGADATAAHEQEILGR